jgi:predicted alpha/beta superfamily hydrolase
MVDSGVFTEIKNNKEIEIPTNIDTIIGSSYGAFVAIGATNYFSDAKNLILFSPAITSPKRI